jgi:hypothetical protein
MPNLMEAKTFVDDRQIMIVTLSPVQDSSRSTQYFGVAKIMLPVGSEDVRFPIPASSLQNAFELYDEHLKKFSDEFQEQVAAAKNDQPEQKE